MRYPTFGHSGAVLVPAILVLCMGSGSALAQGNSYTRMLSTTMSATDSLFRAQTAVIQQRKSMAIAAGVWPAGTSPSPAAAQTPQPMPAQFPITVTDFKPVSPRIMADHLAKTALNMDPEAREAMRKLFDQALTTFEAEARKNNMANAFAFLTAAALQVKTGKVPTDTQTDFLIAYFNNVLGSSREYFTYEPMRLQVLYESLIITGTMIALLDSQGKQTKDLKMQGQAADMSRMVLKQFLGIDAQ